MPFILQPEVVDPSKPLVREAFEYVRNKLGIVLVNYLVRKPFEHVRNKLGIVLVNYYHLFDFKKRAYEIECNIYVVEYTISKGENTIYLTSKEEPMKLSEISIWEGIERVTKSI